MPDICDLLAEAGREPGAAPDLAAIDGRARTLRRQQTAKRVAATVVVVLVAAPLVGRQAGTASHELRQEERPATGATVTPQPPSSPRPTPGGPVAGPVTGPGKGSDGPAGSSATRPSLRPPPPTNTPQTPRAVPARSTASPSPVATSPDGASAEYPRASSCHVSTRDVQTSPEHVCRFTATASGGWSTTGGLAVFADYDPADVRVRVERGGRITYDSAQSERAACADNVVRVGDRVTVTLTTHPNNYEDIDVGAGAGYGC